jgi:hypothetical protein
MDGDRHGKVVAEMTGDAMRFAAREKFWPVLTTFVVKDIWRAQQPVLLRTDSCGARVNRRLIL